MQVISYGSQALALKYLNIPFEHHFVCEFDKYAIQSYNDIHGTNFEVSDIRNISADDLNIVDTDKYKYLMTYSFPCTDLSLAGKRKGMQRESGTSSSLLWEVERLLKECKELPQYLLMENVPQVIGKDNIKLFGEWTSFLTKLGYKNQYKLLNAKDFGVPQNRERCFMVSILKSENKDFAFPKPRPLELRLKDVLEPYEEVDEKYYIKSEKAQKLIQQLIDRGDLQSDDINVFEIGYIEKGTGKHQSNTVYDVSGIAPTLTTVNCLIFINHKIRYLTLKECFRLMGVKDEDYDKLTVSNTQRYKQAGNSIVVDVLMAIFENMFIKDCKSNRLF